MLNNIISISGILSSLTQCNHKHHYNHHPYYHRHYHTVITYPHIYTYLTDWIAYSFQELMFFN